MDEKLSITVSIFGGVGGVPCDGTTDMLLTVMPEALSVVGCNYKCTKKKLSRAEYKKKAKYKALQGKQCADMKNWLRRGCDPVGSATTSEVDIE
nr:unnamed protein product [Callosobruchus analis]